MPARYTEEQRVQLIADSKNRQIFTSKETEIPRLIRDQQEVEILQAIGETTRTAVIMAIVIPFAV